MSRCCWLLMFFLVSFLQADPLGEKISKIERAVARLESEGLARNKSQNQDIPVVGTFQRQGSDLVIEVSESAKLTASQLRTILPKIKSFEYRLAKHQINEVSLRNRNFFFRGGNYFSLELDASSGDVSRIEKQLNATLSALDRSFDGFYVTVDTEYTNREDFKPLLDILENKQAAIRRAGFYQIGISNHARMQKHREGFYLNLDGSLSEQSFEKMLDANLMSIQKVPELLFAYDDPDYPLDHFENIVEILQRNSSHLKRAGVERTLLWVADRSEFDPKGTTLWIGKTSLKTIRRLVEPK